MVKVEILKFKKEIDINTAYLRPILKVGQNVRFSTWSKKQGSKFSSSSSFFQIDNSMSSSFIQNTISIEQSNKKENNNGGKVKDQHEKDKDGGENKEKASKLSKEVVADTQAATTIIGAVHEV